MKRAILLKFKSIVDLLQFKQDRNLYSFEILPGYVLKCQLTEMDVQTAASYRAEMLEPLVFSKQLN